MVQEDSVQEPALYTISKIFYAPKSKTKADFNLPVKNVFDQSGIACYFGYLFELCGKCYSTRPFFYNSDYLSTFRLSFNI